MDYLLILSITGLIIATFIYKPAIFLLRLGSTFEKSLGSAALSLSSIITISAWVYIYQFVIKGTFLVTTAIMPLFYS